MILWLTATFLAGCCMGVLIAVLCQMASEESTVACGDARNGRGGT